MTLSRRTLLCAPLLLAVPAVAAPEDAYAALLDQEHAAIYLYGVLAPRLAEGLRAAARAAYDDHRRHRDMLVAAIEGLGGTPAPAKASYAVPGLATPAAARDFAIRVEDSLAVRWHGAVRDVAPRHRARVASALADEATHLALLRWSGRHVVKDAAVPFPGR